VSFVLCNPVNFNDPTGHKKVRLPLIISPAKDIPVATFEAQYKSEWPNDFNLCGQISLAIVLEAVTGQPELDKMHAIQGGQTLGSDLRDIAAQTFQAGTTITLWYGQGVTQVNDGNKKDILGWNSSLNAANRADALTVMISAHYTGCGVIVDVYVDPGTGKLIAAPPNYNDENDPVNHGYTGVGHWVAVKNISSTSITVVNPFNNDYEDYSLNDFFSTFVHGTILTIDPHKYREGDLREAN